MAAGFIDLFRKVWGWLAVDAGEAPEDPDGSICVFAGGAFVVGLQSPGSAHVISSLAGAAYSIGCDAPGESYTLAASAGGSHTIGQTVKGTANCDC